MENSVLVYITTEGAVRIEDNRDGIDLDANYRIVSSGQDSNSKENRLAEAIIDRISNSDKLSVVYGDVVIQTVRNLLSTIMGDGEVAC